MATNQPLIERQALAELNRLIPEPMRGGLTLEPDAIRVFSRCERSDFG